MHNLVLTLALTLALTLTLTLVCMRVSVEFMGREPLGMAALWKLEWRPLGMASSDGQ